MKYQHFTYKEHGFTGHLVRPNVKSSKAVLIFAGGEKSLLPGIQIAEAFADYGIIGMAVSLFGASGLPKGPDRIPIEMCVKAADWIKENLCPKTLCTYGMSMGSIFAAYTAKYTSIDKVILCSPTHAAFEGSLDKKHRTHHSVITKQGEDLPFIPLDLSSYKAGRYYPHPNQDMQVTGMWLSYRDAYMDLEAGKKASLPIDTISSEVLLIAGSADEMWPSFYSIQMMKKKMDLAKKTNVRILIFKNAGHLVGMMPNRKHHPWVYRALPLIGKMYKRLNDSRKDSLDALEFSRQEIIKFIMYDSIEEEL